MKKIAALVLAGLVFAGCNSSRIYDRGSLETKAATQQKKTETRLRDTIGYENIELRHLDELEFPDEEKVSVPTDLEELLNFSLFQTYRDKEKFRDEIYGGYGLSRKTVSEMSPHELIVKAADIVADNFIFELDRNPKVDGFVEDDWEGKSGDCSMYSYYMKYIFDLLKEDNEKAKNTYITSSYLFGKLSPPILHIWNNIFVVSRNKLQVGMVDVTFYYDRKPLEALDDNHLSNAWKTNFYQALGDYESLRKQLVKDIKQVEDEKEKLQLLKDCAFSFYMDKEYEKGVEAYNEFEAIYNKTDADCLYYQGKCFLKLGEKERAREKFLKLAEKYPESYWGGLAKKEKLID